MHAKRNVILAIIAIGVIAAALVPTRGFGAGGGKGGDSPSKGSGRSAGAAAKNEKYIVVRVGEPTGTGELHVIAKSELNNFKKTTREEDQRLKKDYDEKKKKAIKDKDKEALAQLGKKPVSRIVSTVSTTLFKTQQDAEEWKANHPEKAERKATGA